MSRDGEGGRAQLEDSGVRFMTEGEVHALRACENRVESGVGRLKATLRSETLTRVFVRGINRTVTGVETGSLPLGRSCNHRMM